MVGYDGGFAMGVAEMGGLGAGFLRFLGEIVYTFCDTSFGTGRWAVGVGSGKGNVWELLCVSFSLLFSPGCRYFFTGGFDSYIGTEAG